MRFFSQKYIFSYLCKLLCKKQIAASYSLSWEQRKLNEVGVVIDPHPSHRAPKEEQGGIPFIGIGDVDEMGNINRESARPVPENVYDEHHKRYDLNVPSLGLGRVASLGKVIRLRSDIGKYAISPTISVLQFSENINIDYLYAYMNTPQFKKQFEGKSNGSTRQSVGTEMVRLLNLSMPFNLDEQKAIGTFYKNLDNLITLHQREYEKLHNIKKSMLEKMFPKNGSNVPEIRFKGFTEAWEQRKLGEVLSILKDGTHGTHQDAEEGPYLLSAKNIKNGQIIIDDSSDRKISEDEFNQIHTKFTLENGDILLTIVGSIGESAILENAGKFTFQRSVAFLRPSEEMTSRFLKTEIESVQFQKELNDRKSQSAQPGVYLGDLSKIPIYITSKEEQKKIGEYFSNLDHLITLHQRELEKLQNIKKSMLEKMFV